MNSGRKQPHVACQADQVDTVLAQAGEHIGIVVGAGAALGNKKGVIQAEFTGGGEAGGIGHVGDDDGDLDPGQAAFANGLGDGQEVRSAAGEKNPEAKGAGLGRDVHDQLGELSSASGVSGVSGVSTQVGTESKS